MKLQLKENGKYRILILGVMMLSALLMIYLAALKVGMHGDEYLTYGLANNHEEDGTFSFSPKQGVKVSALEEFDKYFYTDEFNIKNVWVNQGNNVHPPLYYLFFHIFVQLTDHFWALKTGILLNVIFHVINVGIIWLLLQEINSSKFFALVGTVLYAFLPSVLGNVLFIRMYVLMAVFVHGVTLLFLRNWNTNKGKRFYIELGILSVCGALTHYYFLIYLFFICCIWGTRILCEKQWKELRLFVSTMVVAGIITVMIFPYLIVQVFAGKGGKRTADTFWSMSAFFRNIEAFWKALDNVFGGFLCVILVIIMGMLLGHWITNKQNPYKNRTIAKWMIYVIPCICYLVVVSKIAIYAATRYIAPMYGICIISLMSVIEKICMSILADEKIKRVFLLFIVGTILNGSWKQYEWPELYLQTKEYIDVAKEYGINHECIYLHGPTWRVLPNYYELIQYQNVTFIHKRNMELFDDVMMKDYDQVVMYFDIELGEEEINKVLSSMLENNLGLNAFEKLYEYSYSVAYRIY